MHFPVAPSAPGNRPSAPDDRFVYRVGMCGRRGLGLRTGGGGMGGLRLRRELGMTISAKAPACGFFSLSAEFRETRSDAEAKRRHFGEL